MRHQFNKDDLVNTQQSAVVTSRLSSGQESNRKSTLDDLNHFGKEPTNRMGNTTSNTGRGDEPTHVIRNIGDGDTKREHRPVSAESISSEAEASNRKSNTNLAPESSYSYICGRQ